MASLQAKDTLTFRVKNKDLDNLGFGKIAHAVMLPQTWAQFLKGQHTPSKLNMVFPTHLLIWGIFGRKSN